MIYPPVRGDNPRALAFWFSPVQAGKPWYNLSYTTLIRVDVTQYELFAISGNGGTI